MSVPIRPLGDRVVATRVDAPTKTASGLYLPDTAKEKPVMATVVAVGPDVKDVKNDEKIIYKEYSTTELKVDGVEYLVVREEDILGVVTK